MVVNTTSKCFAFNLATRFDLSFDLQVSKLKNKIVQISLYIFCITGLKKV